MTSTHKILNDPIYGFTNLPFGILFDLIEHPYMQRLRRIKQIGLGHYVYPGALHSRFQHVLGALHLTMDAIQVLRSKNIQISEEEALGVQIAVLLHDIGHGPYSHALEGKFINVSHETITLMYMQALNEEFDRALDLVIQIFNNQYHKTFLHDLVASQLDMDRMDYLNRDSYYTGVAEGVIGYDRIIKMLNVYNNRLVVEEKGIYSVEKFLMSRKLMYWQVYLHKAVISAEQMLVRLIDYYKNNFTKPYGIMSNALEKLLLGGHDEVMDNDSFVALHAQLDDVDIDSWVKSLMYQEDPVLQYISKGLIHRKLFRIHLQKSAFNLDFKSNIYNKLEEEHGFSKAVLKDIVIEGTESNKLYDKNAPEIQILMKNGNVQPLSLETDSELDTSEFKLYFICHPKVF